MRRYRWSNSSVELIPSISISRFYAGCIHRFHFIRTIGKDYVDRGTIEGQHPTDRLIYQTGIDQAAAFIHKIPALVRI